MEIPNKLKCYNLSHAKRIGEGERIAFYVGVSQYHKRTNLLFISYRESTDYVAGLYALPIDLLDSLINALQEIRDGLKGNKEKKLKEGRFRVIKRKCPKCGHGWAIDNGKKIFCEWCGFIMEEVEDDGGEI